MVQQERLACSVDKDTFLDLDITLEENRFITKIYNKVDDFDFEVVSFPFPTSNMSDHITYNSFYSQLDFLLSALNLMILIFVVEIYWKVY